MSKIQILTSYLFLLLFISTGFSQENGKIKVDEIVAVVGDQIILSSDIERMSMEYKFPDSLSKMTGKCELFKSVLYQKLLVNQALLDSVNVSDDEVMGEIDRRMNYFISQFGSKERMEQYYDKTILEIKEEMKDAVKEMLLAQRMRSKIVGTYNISPSEVKKFYKDIPKDSLPYYNTEVEVSQIVKNPVPTDDEKKRAKQQLQKIRKQIINGSSFETMAILYSDDPGSSTKGGDLGMQPKSAYVSEFAAAAMKLKKDSISGIVETKFGYHILMLVDRKGERVHVKHILIRPEINSKAIENAKVELLDIKDRILHDTLTFEQAAHLYSDDEATKNSGGAIADPETATAKLSVDDFGDIDPTLVFVVDTMTVGSVSDPISLINYDGSTSYRLVKLVSKTPPHIANLKDDYPKIKDMAEIYYQTDVLEKWFAKTIKETYITIKEPYCDCDVIKSIISTNSKK